MKTHADWMNARLQVIKGFRKDRQFQVARALIAEYRWMLQVYKQLNVEIK